MKKVIITGGAGFIGSNLATRLLNENIEKLLIIDDLSTGTESNLKNILLDQKVDFINSKIEDIEDLNAVFDGYDFCYHLAAGVGVQYIMENLSESLLTNILATHKVLEVCQDRNIPVLLTSTSEIYGTAEDTIWTEETKSLIGPTSKLRWSYAASKMIDEFMALSLYEEGKVSPIIVRLFNIIGPNQLSKFGMVVPRFIESALNNENIVIHGDGSQSRSFTWVDDVVSYLIKLAEIKAYGEVFNIGQTEEITIKELAELVIEKTSSESKIIYKTHEEVFGKAFDDPKRRTPGIEKIIKFTGIEPSKNIDFMIENIINHKKLNYKVNILITTGIYPPDVGGPAKFVPLISKHLSNENGVRIITLSEDSKLNQDEINQVHRIKRNQNKIIRFLKTVLSIIKFGKNVEVIFVNGLWLEVYIANLALRKKIVRKIVGDPVWEKLFTQNKIFDSFDTFQKNTYNLKVQLYKFIRNIVIKSANIIVVPSNHLYEFVKNINFSGELIKINNGTLLTDALEKNFIETNFLIVSRLVKHKNIDLIIKSLYSLKNKYSLDFNLDIVGEGPERIKLNDLINHLNLNSCVNLVGSKHGEDLENFYKNSNYFLQISSYEGMPHTILEAMNHKLVIIASNFGGNYELIGENIYGYLVESIKENEIVNAIKVAVDDVDKESKVIKAKEMIEKEYNIESTIKSYSEVILKND